jgi:Uma2 family endonuclease
MAMPAHTLEWTAEMARALPDDSNRYEVLDGELFVTPAPSYLHQRVLGALYPALRAYAEEHRIGWALFSPADIEFSPRRLVQPDLFVVPWADQEPGSWRDVSSLVLAVEVLSPSTARADCTVKRRVYQDEGVPEYWIVDSDARRIERWRPDDAKPELLEGALTWAPRPKVPPLVIPIHALFGSADG